MAKKHKHEEHANHEAWAIPYGDLVTLLLAFFVVMYAVSSVNEGKYRVLAEALSDSFGGTPKSMKPIQFGKQQQHGSNADQKLSPVKMSKSDPAVAGSLRDLRNPTVFASKDPAIIATSQLNSRGNTGYERSKAELREMGKQIEQAMGDLIRQELIRVRRSEVSLEIEMNTDILFSSGSAQVAEASQPVLQELAGILGPFTQPLRIEGHTDNIPISTTAFPSNWELSAARAAGVVHLFVQQGLDPVRMTVSGMGEYQPLDDNRTAEGRNHNRRVVIVILAQPGPEPDAAATATEPAQSGAALVPVPEENLHFPTVVVPEGTLKSLQQTEDRHG